MSFRVEDGDRAQAKAAAAEAAFEKERLEFQTALKSQQQQFELYLKEAVSEAKALDGELKNAKNCIDEMKVRHKNVITKIKRDNARAIQAKNVRVKEAEELAQGLHVLFNDMVDEVGQASKSSRKSQNDLIAAKAKASKAHAAYVEHKLLSNLLTDEVRDAQLNEKSYREKVEEYGEIIEYLSQQLEDQESEFDDILQFIDSCVGNTACEPTPRVIAKHYVPNKRGGGKHAEWLPHVDKLILEMLTNRTPPTCIQANLVAMAEVLCPDMNLVRELPSLKHIKNLRTALYTVTKTLAAYRLADAKDWKQVHSDETSRRQTSLLNFLMGLLTQDNKFKAICIDLALISKNGTAPEQSRSVLTALRDCKILLQEWRTTTASMFPDKPELIDLIPDPSLIDITRMAGTMIEHDSCNTARAFGSILCDSIKEEIAAKTNQAPEKKEEQLKSAEKALIDATYLHKQYHSPACWQTVEDADANWERLKTKKDKMKHVKENILIRYLGLGWVEAHHPWSRKQDGIQHTFTSDELFQHLIEVVIPLADKKEMPLYAPVKLPELPDNFTLGTRSAVRKNLDEKHEDLEVDVRRRAKVELERMEESGITDGVCWEFQVDDEDGYLVEELRWCSGVVTALVRDKSEKHNFIDVKVQWNEEWVEYEDERVTVQRLKKREFNPSKPFQDAWREDLSDNFEGEMI
eukprot:scaffold2510_cov65-Cyclotella_meneghiniana.AAC.1